MAKTMAIGSIASYACTGLLFLGCLGFGSAQTSTTCNTTLDAVFVMDGSNSIQQWHFHRMLNSMLSVLPQLPVTVGQMQIGAVIYGTENSQMSRLFPLTSNRLQLTYDIQSAMDLPDGTTNTLEALQQARLLLQSGRQKVPQAIVLMTDGESNRDADVRQLATNFKGQGIKIFTVGVGENIDEKELRALSSDSVVHTVNTIPSLISSMRQSSAVVCVDCKKGVDLVFIMDGSNSVSYISFRAAMRSIEQGAYAFWANYPDSYLGLIIYGSEVGNTIVPTNNRTAFVGLDGLVYPDTQTGTSKALLRGIDMLGQTGSARTTVAKVLVVITDGVSDNRPATEAAANYARNQNISVFAIGVGSAVNRAELNKIGNGGVYRVQNVAQLVTSLSPIVSSICSGRVSM